MVQLDPDADEKNLEDRSKAKYVTPLLSPFLKEKKNFFFVCAGQQLLHIFTKKKY